MKQLFVPLLCLLALVATTDTRLEAAEFKKAADSCKNAHAIFGWSDFRKIADETEDEFERRRTMPWTKVGWVVGMIPPGYKGAGTGPGAKACPHSGAQPDGVSSSSSGGSSSSGSDSSSSSGGSSSSGSSSSSGGLDASASSSSSSSSGGSSSGGTKKADDSGCTSTTTGGHPATLLLLAMALIGLIIRRRRVV